MPARPDFFLANPVARSFSVGDRFNAPREYKHAPTKLQLHEGIDIMAIDGQGGPVAVMAAQRGMVDLVGYSGDGYGNYVRVVHPWGREKFITWYGHLSAVTARQGQFVLAGQKIGIAGSTGYSWGIHLHLTLQWIGHGLSNYVVDDVVDPEPFCHPNLAPAVFDEASFVADVTLPDGSVVQPGQALRKTWRVRNTGTTTWDDRWRLIFVRDDPLGGPGEAPLDRTPIAPGETADLTVKLTAPGAAGTHRSVWQLRNGAGEVCDGELFAALTIRETAPFDRATFVADVTVEDGTILPAGQAFVKTWRIRNSGTTTWTREYSLRFAGDKQMGGPERVPLPREVRPGELLEMSVTLTAPTEAGRHRSTWKLVDARGNQFPEDMFAEIQVPEERMGLAAAGLNELRFVADVTVPDHTTLRPGERFVKTWRVRNSGETTWGPGYTLGFFGDDRMDGPESVPLPPARPGQMVEVSVPLIAPATPGARRSTWKPRDPQGRAFEFDLFALIDVPEPTVAADLNELSFVADVTVPDGASMHPGEAFVKTWRVRNTGSAAWGPGYTLAHFGEEKMDGPDNVPLRPAAPGDVAEVSLMLTAPAEPGLHKSVWQARDAQGQFFPFDLFALIEVIDPSRQHDILDFLRGDGRLYDLEFNWAGGGRQRVQTQVEGDCFYHVKQTEWEELWADEHFIYRGTDTSPGGGEVYTLFESGQYGSPWIPRKMTIGAPFKRTPTVVFRRKADGADVPGKSAAQTTWIVLEDVRGRMTMPSGVELSDVAVLAAFEDSNGRPAAKPFERYYYGRGYGLVGWEGDLGRSTIVQEFARGAQPDNVREVIGWLRR